MEECTSNRGAENLDDPPNSRLFIVSSRTVTEEQIRDSFSAYGDIQGIWLVKDKNTKESRGVAYVKYAKSSQACLAMETMNGRLLGEGTKPIKVFIAQSRNSSKHRDVEDEDLTRIFVMIPKTFTEEDLVQTFKEYGDIEYAIVIKNKTTGESKGLGYVRYYKPSQAALAIENCDKSYKAVVAEPRTKSGTGEDYGTATAAYMNSGDSFRQSSAYSYQYLDYRSGEYTRSLMVSTRAALSQEQFFALFDLIPGLEYCELQRDYGQALIRYNNLGSAVYAKEKLNGFEYPPGNRLVVARFFSIRSRETVSLMLSVCVQGYSAVGPVSTRIQTDVNLPPPQKLAPRDSQSKERLFVVFTPTVLPLDVLEDVFCRFGSLIEVHLVPGRKVGYMKYADKQCADEAMAMLHGRFVNGVKMKVMLADPPREESHKRPRTY
uniref:RRM domain-containing protein n=1 Tax=Periophthalmus magnuspinnatus TaxID=409849 RepID=A0A3B3ZBF0_9GOBI